MSVTTLPDRPVSLPDLRKAKGHVSVRSHVNDKETRTISSDILEEREAQVFKRGKRGEEGSQRGEGRASLRTSSVTSCTYSLVGGHSSSSSP